MPTDRASEEPPQASASDLALKVPCPFCGERHPQEMLTCPKHGGLLPLEGRLLAGKFRLLSALGRGGMSTVWRAENALVRKRVAIKLMLPELLGNAQTLQRFRNEATAAGRIGNRHICDILDFGESKAGPFIVMEMLRGQDLGRLIERRGRLEPGVAVWIVRQALLGLQAAHAANIIHRDLKPENLFLHEPAPGQILVKLMDFGISKFSEVGGLSKTATGIIMGTPGYMSPEQIQGAANADERADIWAMGVMLYTSIWGQEPFQGENFAKVLMAVTTTEPERLDQRLPGVDPKLAEVVQRCLNKDPGQRFKTCDEMREALEPFETEVDQEALQIGHGPNALLPKETPTDLTVPDRVPDRVEVRADVGEATRPPVWKGDLVDPPPHLDAMEVHPAGGQFPTVGPREGLAMDTAQTVGPREGLDPAALSTGGKRDGQWGGGPQVRENATLWSMGRGALNVRTWGSAGGREGPSGKKALAVLGAALLLVGGIATAGYLGYQYWSELEPEPDPAVAVNQSPGKEGDPKQEREQKPEAAKPGAGGDNPGAGTPSTAQPDNNANQPQPDAGLPDRGKPVEPQQPEPEPEPEPKTQKPQRPKTQKPKRPRQPKTGGSRPQRPRPGSSGEPVNVDNNKVRRLAGYYIPRASPPNKSHAQARAHCASLRRDRFAGLREWQLPSSSWLLGRIGALKPTRYWSKSRGTRSAKAADLGFGRKVIDDDPNKSYRSLCVAKR